MAKGCREASSDCQRAFGPMIGKRLILLPGSIVWVLSCIWAGSFTTGVLQSLFSWIGSLAVALWGQQLFMNLSDCSTCGKLTTRLLYCRRCDYVAGIRKRYHSKPCPECPHDYGHHSETCTVEGCPCTYTPEEFSAVWPKEKTGRIRD